MARKKSPSRLDKRKEAEAADARDAADGKKKAKKPVKAKAKRTTRKKSKATDRRRLMWGVFNGSMKEEARFPYDQLKEAEERMEQLRAKGKRMYFIQPIKEVITEPLVEAKREA